MIALYLAQREGCFAPINSLTSRPISNIFRIYFIREKETSLFSYRVYFFFFPFLKKKKKYSSALRYKFLLFFRRDGRKKKKYKITSINIAFVSGTKASSSPSDAFTPIFRNDRHSNISYMTFLTLTLFVKACAIERRWHSAVRHSCIHSPFSLLLRPCTLWRTAVRFWTRSLRACIYIYITFPVTFVARKNGLFRQPSFPLSFLPPEHSLNFLFAFSFPFYIRYIRSNYITDTRRYPFVFIDNEVRREPRRRLSTFALHPRRMGGSFSRKRPKDITR